MSQAGPATPVVASPAQPDSPAVRVRGIAKAFGATQAVRSASLEVRAGEVHCIVGENGSGKSTLVKILTGIHKPDEGSLELFGREARLRSPRDAARAGIATVFQEVLVVEPRSVLDNIWLGTANVFSDPVPPREKRRPAAELLEKLLAGAPHLDAPVEQLSLSDRQACCIVRALVRNPRVLILDEATSALDVATRDRLFGLLRDFAARSTAVIFISHRMDEISEIGDRCTVMRSGETVATLSRGETSTTQLVQLMTGAEQLDQLFERPTASGRSEVVLTTRDLSLAPGAPTLDLEIRAGELVGVAGLEGHGQDALLHMLWRGPSFGGEVAVLGRPVHDAVGAAAAGLSYVPRERRAESLFESKSIYENFGLPTLDQDISHGLWRISGTRARFADWAQRLSIRLSDDRDLITTLSGGNQQKVVMARALAMRPRVLLLNDPTRGIDMGAKHDLYHLLAELASQGLAIVMVSSDVDEHVELMDRVLVLREFSLSREIGRDQLSRQALVSAFFGVAE